MPLLSTASRYKVLVIATPMLDWNLNVLFTVIIIFTTINLDNNQGEPDQGI